MNTMNTPPIVSAQEWTAAHQELLVQEKEVMRAHDALAAQRRRMPWLAVDKDYEFEGPEGKLNLRGLFQGRRQLLVYRDPQAGDYTTQQALGPADTVSPLAAPAAAVRVADLLV